MMTSGSNAEVALASKSSSFHLATPTHVFYSCGSCGYELNLNSCNRNVSVMDETYGKLMKRGVISFFSIDESRFTQINKLRWWRLFHRRTKLLCRNCGTCVGTATNNWDNATCSSSSSSLSPFKVATKQRTATWDGMSTRRMYEIKIRSLRPLEHSALICASATEVL